MFFLILDEFTDRLERHKTEGMAEEQATIAKGLNFPVQYSMT